MKEVSPALARYVTMSTQELMQEEARPNAQLTTTGRDNVWLGLAQHMIQEHKLGVPAGRVEAWLQEPHQAQDPLRSYKALYASANIERQGGRGPILEVLRGPRGEPPRDVGTWH